jgi:phosphocarrier protein HPr
MPSIICEVVNIKGMHARAAAKIVNLNSKYETKVTLTHKNTSVAGDSLIKLLTLNAPKGSKILIEATGDNCEILLAQLKYLFAIGFEE